mgnify:CR=1 FL=1
MQVETPACVVDLDAVKHNIRVAVQMVTDAAPGRRVKIRPHAKSHKCTQLAQLQIVRVGVWGGVVPVNAVVTHQPWPPDPHCRTCRAA